MPNIEIGTRVCNKGNHLKLEGTFVGMRGIYYQVKWDSTPKHRPPHLHTQSEFEVIS